MLGATVPRCSFVPRRLNLLSSALRGQPVTLCLRMYSQLSRRPSAVHALRGLVLVSDQRSVVDCVATRGRLACVRRPEQRTQACGDSPTRAYNTQSSQRPGVTIYQVATGFAKLDNPNQQQTHTKATPRLNSSQSNSTTAAAAAVGVAILRISGPGALTALQRLTQKSYNSKQQSNSKSASASASAASPSTIPRQFAPRQAYKVAIHDPHSGALIDSPVLALYFPSPHSFTGEDCAELQCHGNPFIVRRLMQAIQSLNPMTNDSVTPMSFLYREATAGEFTRRAFLTGKLDLTQVEGLSELLNAETPHQLQLALQQSNGLAYRLYKSWTDRVATHLACSEAMIDFAEDEDDVSLGELKLMRDMARDVESLLVAIQHHLATSSRGELIRDGLRCVLLGRVNSGKSTLLNSLLQRPAAIVSSQAGTTRDTIQATLQLANGVALHLMDTAGLRHETTDAIERVGMQRAMQHAQRAHYRIVLLDATQLATRKSDSEFGDDSFAVLQQQPIDDLDLVLKQVSENTILVLTKCDALSGELQQLNGTQLLKRLAPRLLESMPIQPVACVAIACPEAARQDILAEQDNNDSLNPSIESESATSTHSGHEPLLAALEQLIDARINDNGPTQDSQSALDADTQSARTCILSQERHRQCLVVCHDALMQWQQHMTLSAPPRYDLGVEQLRCALRALGQLTGRVGVEQLLDVIFARFCIGK